MAGEGPVMSQLPSVPSSIGGGGGGTGIDSLISAGIKPIPDEMVMRAFSPTFQSHAMGVPSSMTRPIPDFKPQPMDERQVVGRGNARAQGIGNAITGVANGIGAFINSKAKLKQTQNAQKVSQLIEYQQGIDAAKEALKNDPNNAEAKQALEQNQHNRDAMFEDQKFVKTVQKGFNISFTDPSANKTEDHAAVQQGVDIAKKRAASMGQQWADKQPVKPTPNLMAQQQLAMATQQQAAFAKVYASVIPRILASKETMLRTQYVQGMQNARQMQTHVFDAWKLGQQFAHDNQLAGLRHEFKLDEITKTIQMGGQKALELFQTEQLDPTKLFQTETQFGEKMAGAESTMSSALSSTMQKLATAQASASRASGQDKAAINQTVQQLQYQVNALRQQQQNLQDFKGRWYSIMGNLKEISAGMSGGDSNGSGAGTGNGSQQQPAGSTGPNAFDPSALLYNTPFQYGASPSTSALLPGSDSGSDEDDDEEAD
jgi:hypothetical protein